jgi:hypothetical protein
VVVVVLPEKRQEPSVVRESVAREVEQTPEPTVQLSQDPVVVVMIASRVATVDQVLS